jgi:hypothetical protein
MNDDERQARIRQLAHRIWESEGRPPGQAARHWQMAEKLVDAELGQAPPRRDGEPPEPSPSDADPHDGEPGRADDE